MQETLALGKREFEYPKALIFPTKLLISRRECVQNSFTNLWLSADFGVGFLAGDPGDDAAALGEHPRLHGRVHALVELEVVACHLPALLLTAASSILIVVGFSP